ncbi:hypothetical protein D1004_10715 [Riemerella anatipestifer]|nr:hypothetical protein [Riemerella anatipestifer]
MISFLFQSKGSSICLFYPVTRCIAIIILSISLIAVSLFSNSLNTLLAFFLDFILSLNTGMTPSNCYLIEFIF